MSKLHLVCYKGDSIFDKLIRIITQKEYTHVGLVASDTIDETAEDITYMACREEAGLCNYTVPMEEVDIYEIHLQDSRHALYLFGEECNKLYGSMIADMGYPELHKPNSMGSVEWVARALMLGLPKRYTIDKLIAYANITI